MDWGSQWNKLKTWNHVQSAILQTFSHEDTSEALKEGVKEVQTIHHEQQIHSVDQLITPDGPLFITNTGTDIRSYLNVWIVKGTQLQRRSINVASKIELLKYVPGVKRLAMFTADLKIKLADDVTRVCEKLHIFKVPVSIVCMEYNSDSDEILVGGTGFITKFKVTDEAIVGTLPLNIIMQPTETVKMIRVDLENSQLLLLTGQTIYIMNYVGNRVIHELNNCHNAELTSCTFYKPRDYFLTAAADGSVKVWNCSVFTEIHSWFAHSNSITGMATHSEEPLLFTSSTDTFVRVWRLDTYEVVHKVEVDKPVLDLRMLKGDNFFYRTANDIKLMKCPIMAVCVGLPGAILACTQNQEVRIVQPSTGLTFTVADFTSLTTKDENKSNKGSFNQVAYIRRQNSLYVVRPKEGDVIVWKASSNPCVPSQLLMPDREKKKLVTAITTVKLDCALGQAETNKTEYLIFAGHKNGEITLIHSTTAKLIVRCQAHSKAVRILSTTSGDIGGHSQAPWNKDLLYSYAADKKVRIWGLEVETADTSSLCLKPLISVHMSESPSHIFLLGAVLAYTQTGKAKNSRLCMLFLSDDHPKVMASDGVTLLSDNDLSSVDRIAGGFCTMTHIAEHDHSQPITGLDGHSKFHLFCTSAEDGFLKVWDKHNNLVRLIQLDNTLSTCCFADDKATILFGYRNHLNSLSIDKYLPRDWLQKVVLFDFMLEPGVCLAAGGSLRFLLFTKEDEMFEDVLVFNPDIKARTLESLPQFAAIDPDKNLQPATPPGSAKETPMTNKDSDDEAVDEKTAKDVEKIQQNWKKLGMSGQMAAKLVYGLSKKAGEIVTQRKRAEMPVWNLQVKDREVAKYRKTKGDQVREERRKRMELIRKMEEEAKRKKWMPIAPDGFVPNSMIRQVLQDATAQLSEKEQAKLGQMAFFLAKLPDMDLATTAKHMLARRKYKRRSKKGEATETTYDHYGPTKKYLVTEDQRSRGLSDLRWCDEPYFVVTDLGFLGGDLVHVLAEKLAQQQLLVAEDTTLSDGGTSAVGARSSLATPVQPVDDENFLLKSLLKLMSKEPWWPKGMLPLPSNAINLICRQLPRSEGRKHSKLVQYLDEINGHEAVADDLKPSLANAVLHHIALNRGTADVINDCLNLIKRVQLKYDPIIQEMARLVTDSLEESVKWNAKELLKELTGIPNDKQLMLAIKGDTLLTVKDDTPPPLDPSPPNSQTGLTLKSDAAGNKQTVGPKPTVSVFGERKRKPYIAKAKTESDEQPVRSEILRSPPLKSFTDVSEDMKRQAVKDYLDREEAETWERVDSLTRALTRSADSRLSGRGSPVGSEYSSGRRTSRSRSRKSSRGKSADDILVGSRTSFLSPDNYDVEAYDFFDSQLGSNFDGRTSRKDSLVFSDDLTWDYVIQGPRKKFQSKSKTVSDSGIFSYNKHFDWQSDVPGFEDRGSLIPNSSLVISGQSFGPLSGGHISVDIEEAERRRHRRNAMDRKSMAEARRMLFFRDVLGVDEDSLTGQEAMDGVEISGISYNTKKDGLSKLSPPVKQQKPDLATITSASKDAVARSLKAKFSEGGYVKERLPRINSSNTNLIRSHVGIDEPAVSKQSNLRDRDHMMSDKLDEMVKARLLLGSSFEPRGDAVNRRLLAFTSGLDNPAGFNPEWHTLHEKYCSYYRLVRRRMQEYLSVSKNLHNMELAKSLCDSRRHYRRAL